MTAKSLKSKTARHVANAKRAKAELRAAKQRAACPIARLFPEQSALIAAQDTAVMQQNDYQGIIGDRIDLNEAIARGTKTQTAWGAMWQIALMLVDVHDIVGNCVPQKEGDEATVEADQLLRRIEAAGHSVLSFLQNLDPPDYFVTSTISYHLTSGPHYRLARIIEDPSILDSKDAPEQTRADPGLPAGQTRAQLN
jgi:hypothetical protein